jgi:hypothetical protein
VQCGLQGHDDADEESDEGNDGNGPDANEHRLTACTLKTQAAFQG